MDNSYRGVLKDFRPKIKSDIPGNNYTAKFLCSSYKYHKGQQTSNAYKTTLSVQKILKKIVN